MMQNPRAAPADPAKPKYNAIAPDTMCTRLCGGVRCAPNKCGATNPAMPTITKITPRSLQTVFAILLGSSCETFKRVRCYQRHRFMCEGLSRNARIVHQPGKINTRFLIESLRINPRV